MVQLQTFGSRPNLYAFNLSKANADNYSNMNFSSVAYIALLALSLIASCSESPVSAQAQVGERNHLAVGTEYQPCDDCPIFVRVPDAPEGLRAIRYVAKFPLTWRRYMASVNQGSCRVPSKQFQGIDRVHWAGNHVDELDIEWPVSILDQREIDCFVKWVQSQTHYEVVIPTAQEWNWFALSGDLSSKFPWGDRLDSPPAAVRGVEIPLENLIAPLRNRASPYLLSGVTVGLFPPNNWGIYDVVGNEYELTSTKATGRDGFIVKGGSIDWELRPSGIANPSIAVSVVDGSFSANVALRLVLISRD